MKHIGIRTTRSASLAAMARRRGLFLCIAVVLLASLLPGATPAALAEHQPPQ